LGRCFRLRLRIFGHYLSVASLDLAIPAASEFG
jgi:hypothetical protein